MFIDMRPRGDGFACDVCDDSSWAVQLQAIREFLSDFASCIRRARSAGLVVTIDTLIDAKDLASVAIKVIAFDPDLLKAFGDAGIRLEISSYDSSSSDPSE